MTSNNGIIMNHIAIIIAAQHYSIVMMISLDYAATNLKSPHIGYGYIS